MKVRNAQRQINQSGVILIEFALVFPFFLLLVFFLYWLGNLLHTKEVLYSAVTTGVHIGKTRGDYKALHTENATGQRGLLPVVDEFVDSGIWSSRLNKLLGSPRSEAEAVSVKDIYERFLTNAECVLRHRAEDGKQYRACFYPQAGMRSVPRESLYALIFIANDMKRSLGKEIGIPCDPGSENDIIGGTQSQSACLRCNLLPLDEMGIGHCRNASEPCHSLLTAEGIARDRFGIECFYRYPNAMLDGLFRVLGMNGFGSGVLLKAKEWVFLNVSEFCLTNPNARGCVS